MLWITANRKENERKKEKRGMAFIQAGRLLCLYSLRFSSSAIQIIM
jgi:hypothetical protein